MSRAALAHVIQALAYWRLRSILQKGLPDWAGPRSGSTWHSRMGSTSTPITTLRTIGSTGLCADSLRECQEQLLESDRSLARMTVPAPSVESAAKYRVLGEWHAFARSGAMRPNAWGRWSKWTA